MRTQDITFGIEGKEQLARALIAHLRYIVRDVGKIGQNNAAIHIELAIQELEIYMENLKTREHLRPLRH